MYHARTRSLFPGSNEDQAAGGGSRTRKDTMDTSEQHRGDDATGAARWARRLAGSVRSGNRKRRARMRMIPFAGAALLVGLAGVTTAAGGVGSAQKVMCTVKLHSVSAPDAATGEDLGTTDCAPTFGKGVVHDTITVTPTSKTTGTVDGRFKEFYDTGTISGTFKLTYAIKNDVVTSTGTARISAGTGAYRNARGSVKVTCESTSRTTTTCKEPRTVTVG